jgi:hypothetical protein
MVSRRSYGSIENQPGTQDETAAPVLPSLMGYSAGRARGARIIARERAEARAKILGESTDKDWTTVLGLHRRTKRSRSVREENK